MNLNSWYRLAWRRASYACRRAFFHFDTPIRRKLWAEKRYLAHPDTITEEARHRLGQINHTLGEDPIYQLTPEQQERGLRLVRDIVEKLRKKRLEYLRGEIRAERISYGELKELQSLAAYIEPGDVELLEAAGVPEHTTKEE